MKINFKSLTVLSSIGNQVLATTCDTKDITQPEHFKEWDCDPKAPPGGLVPPRTRCYLICEEGYDPIGSPRDYHRCRKTGSWTHAYLSCQPDIQTWQKKIEERLDADEKNIGDNTVAIADNAEDIADNAEDIAENVDDIDDIEDDIAINREDIAGNSERIDENGQNIQDGFRDIMNFNAIQLITSAHLENPVGGLGFETGPLVVEINGSSGYACDVHKALNQDTANRLCQEAKYPGAEPNGWKIEAPTQPDNYPLVVGDMLCPGDAMDLSTCTSSGWGDLREPACNNYDAVLYLTCTLEL